MFYQTDLPVDFLTKVFAMLNIFFDYEAEIIKIISLCRGIKCGKNQGF